MPERSQRYYCRDCNNNFSDFTDTKFAKSQIPMGVILYILLNLDNKSYVDLSNETGYSRQAISRLNKFFKNEIFQNKILLLDFEEEMQKLSKLYKKKKG